MIVHKTLLRMNSYVKVLKGHLFNIPGWQTTRKIVVFESDDWGSIRMSSKEDAEKLKYSGLPIERCAYMTYDALESEEDLDFLFNLLAAKRRADRKPVITANFLTANPNFQKIKMSGFREYHYESCLETVKRYPRHSKVPEYWFSGNENGFFRPQLHGREHLNISRWMSDLQNNVKETMLAFNLNMFGISGTVSQIKRGSYLAAYDGAAKELKYDRSEIVKDAVIQFESIFGYKSKTVIAPNYTWDDVVERALSEHGIKFIQGANVQRLSRDFGDKLRIKRHYLGQKNNLDQTYLTRNCSFEPSSNPSKDWIDSCMSEIATAFTWNKPAIISVHRLNFIGYINQKNRDLNLKLFSDLIDRINKKWPQVEYMSSDQLSNLIN